MRNYLISLAFLLAACGGASDPEQPGATGETGDSELTTSSRNEDVQVLKVYNGESFSLSKGSIYPAIDQEKCKPEGTTWTKIKAHDQETKGHLRVTLDCTEAVEKKFGLPSMRDIKVTGYRSRKGEEAAYGYVSFSNSGGSFWVKTVELVVKESAIDSESLHGIGFFLNAFSYRYYEAPPASGDNNGNAHFIFADDVRSQSKAHPATTLKSGDKARVIKVLLPSEYALGGTSSVPAFYFRPFAEYVSGADKHQRWDSAASDYFVTSNTDFNREGDILKP